MSKRARQGLAKQECPMVAGNTVESLALVVRGLVDRVTVLEGQLEQLEEDLACLTDGGSTVEEEEVQGSQPMEHEVLTVCDACNAANPLGMLRCEFCNHRLI